MKGIDRIVGFIVASLCAVLLSDAVTAQAKGLTFNTINKASDGLSNDEVLSVMVDSRGFVWIGTALGLNRYDGTRMRTFNKEDLHLESDYILALGEDTDGNIWIGTSNGVSYYDYASDRFVIPSATDGQTPSTNCSYNIARNPDGTMWFGTADGQVWSYDHSDGFLSKHGTGSQNYVKNIFFNGSGDVFALLYYGKILRFDKELDSFSPIDIGEYSGFFDGDDLAVPLFVTESDDILYVAGKERGLCRVDLRKKEVERLLPFKDNLRPTDMMLSEKRFICISSTQGLIRYDIYTGESVIVGDLDLRCIAGDSDGGLWLGTALGGVEYSLPDDRRISAYQVSEDGLSLKNCVVSGMAEDDKGNIFIATSHRGLLKMDAASGELRAFEVEGLPVSLNCISCYKGDLWVGTVTGICRIDLRSRTMRKYLDSKGRAVDYRTNDMLVSSDGVLLAAMSQGVVYYDAKSDSFRYLFPSIGTSMQTITEDNEGTFWMTSYSRGLFSFDPSVMTSPLSHPEPGEGAMFSSVFVDSKDRIWVLGKQGSILRYDKVTSAFHQFDSKTLQSLPYGSFGYAIEDDEGLLWISSSEGLVNFDVESGTVRLFTQKDGLSVGSLCGKPLPASSGSFWFGASDGLVFFSPHKLVTDAGAPEVQFTELFIDDKESVPGDASKAIDVNIGMSKRILLKARYNSFAVNVSIPRSGKHNPILYMLDPFDRGNHVLSGDMVIRYFNLSPGKYTLKMWSQDSYGYLVPCHDDVQVVVKPPFLMSFFGIMLVVMLMLAMISAVLWYFNRKEKERVRKLREEYERRRDAEMVKEKMDFFSGVIHEIKTPLTIISSPVKELIANSGSLPEEMRRDLEAIGNSSEYMNQLVRELLEFIRSEDASYTITPRNINIVEMLDGVISKFQPEFAQRQIELRNSYKDCGDVVIAADERALKKIFNNLLDNALKYAGSWFAVNLQKANGKVRIAFSNDGPEIPETSREEIFRPFANFSTKGGTSAQSFGIGLSFSRRLAELHEGSLSLSGGSPVCFVLELPDTVIIEEEPQEEQLDDSVPAKRILIVEDSDDFSSYLRRKLLPSYSVSSSKSAENALQLLKGQPFDLVLSDIGLPGIDGVELCRMIKNDFEISHIPVIMVSGISSEQIKTECMRTGASLYVEKPFSIDYLKACIKSLFDSREQLKQQIAQSNSMPDLSSFHIVDKDAEFLANLDTVVMEHLEDESFSVQQLCGILFMSHSTLSRKVQGLLGMNVVEYIRNKRLSIAAGLLKSGKVLPGEVWFKVGFSSMSYFTKCFKAMYGMTPGEYARKDSQTD